MTHKKHWETHLYTYAFFCLNALGAITDESREKMRSKCLSHGHTEGECLGVEADPSGFIQSGVLGG